MQAIFIVPLGIYLSIISLWKEKSSRFGQTVVSKNVRLYLIFRRNRQFLSILSMGILSITYFFFLPNLVLYSKLHFQSFEVLYIIIFESTTFFCYYCSKFL